MHPGVYQWAGKPMPQGRKSQDRRCSLPTWNKSTNNLQSTKIDQKVKIKKSSFTFASPIKLFNYIFPLFSGFLRWPRCIKFGLYGGFNFSKKYTKFEISIF